MAGSKSASNHGRSVRKGRVGNTSSSNQLSGPNFPMKNGASGKGGQGDTGNHGSKVKLPKGKMPKSMG